MWLKIQIGIFLIAGTGLITLFFMAIAMVMEWVYGNSPAERERRLQETK